MLLTADLILYSPVLLSIGPFEMLAQMQAKKGKWVETQNDNVLIKTTLF
jgi:hypothetical protein